MKIFLLLIFFSFSAISYAQVDYLEFKAAYTISCTPTDSISLVKNEMLLDSLNNLGVTSGKDLFLYDYGWLYFMKYLRWRKKEDIDKSANIFEQCWSNHENLSALWNLGDIYREMGNCSKSLEVIELYVLHAKKTSLDIDYKQIFERYKGCAVSK